MICKNVFMLKWLIDKNDIIFRNEVITIEKKNCKICGENKYLTDYYTQNKKRVDGTPYIYYNPECKQCTKMKSTKWGEDNRERKREHWRKHSALPHKRELQNKLTKEARENGSYREWQRNNKDKIQGYNKDRQQHKMHDITLNEWENCKDYFNNECAYCGLHISEHFNNYGDILKWTDFHKEHVDHVGSNDITNCIPSCKSCNSSKHTSILEEWYTSSNPNYREERLNKIYKWLFEDVYNSKIV